MRIVIIQLGNKLFIKEFLKSKHYFRDVNIRLRPIKSMGVNYLAGCQASAVKVRGLFSLKVYRVMAQSQCRRSVTEP